MNGPSSAQLHFDFRTGCLSGIEFDRPIDEQRAACAALNRQRARGILEVSEQAPPGKPVSPDVWTATFERATAEWDVPLISLEKLGIWHDRDGFRTAPEFIALKPGREASPYLDPVAKVVYKLFDLRTDGALGQKKTVTVFDDQIEIVHGDAVLRDTLEKLSILNLAGGHPTEIVGLASEGDYLIVKQAQAFKYKDLHADMNRALDRLIGAPLSCRGLRHRTLVVWALDQPWIVADFHELNLMRDAEDEPTIIDALTGAIPPSVIRELERVAFAVEQAKALAKGEKPPERVPFDAVDDDSL